MPGRFWMWVAFVSVVSIITPPYGVAEIVGGLVTSLLVYVLPVWIWIALRRRKK